HDLELDRLADLEAAAGDDRGFARGVVGLVRQQRGRQQVSRLELLHQERQGSVRAPDALARTGRRGIASGTVEERPERREEPRGWGHRGLLNRVSPLKAYRP